MSFNKVNLSKQLLDYRTLEGVLQNGKQAAGLRTVQVE